MIKLKELIVPGQRPDYPDQRPDKSLDEFILSNKIYSLTDWVHHGTPYEGLAGMLVKGIYGSEHGEVAEHDAFSTSLNPEVTYHFSEGNGYTGLQFKVTNAQVVVLDDILIYLVTQLPGSGMSADVDEEEMYEFGTKYNIPENARGPFLPYNYLSSLGVDAFMYEYVWKLHTSRSSHQVNDEAEVCFIGNKGIALINKSIDSIYVDGDEYELSQKKEVLKILKKHIYDKA